MPHPESIRDSCTSTIPKRGEKLACVESIQESVVRVRCVTAAQRAEVRKLGGTRLLPFGNTWRLRHANEHELGALLAKLRDLGFLMAGASSGWPPAGVFRSLREKGLITGTFRELLYKSPAERMIYEER